MMEAMWVSFVLLAVFPGDVPTPDEWGWETEAECRVHVEMRLNNAGALWAAAGFFGTRPIPDYHGFCISPDCVVTRSQSRGGGYTMGAPWTFRGQYEWAAAIGVPEGVATKKKCRPVA